jgi:hypothetical protein
VFYEMPREFYDTPGQKDRLYQGEIVSNLVQGCLDVTMLGTRGRPRVDLITHPYAMVVTQDCDLESDFMLRTAQRYSGSALRSVLLCEVSLAEELRNAQEMKSNIWQRVRANKDERYQYLRAIGSHLDALGEGVPDLAIDFKRYFTIPTDEFYRRLELGEVRRRAYLISPWKEHLSTRFFYYLYRVALPEDHYQKQATT